MDEIISWILLGISVLINFLQMFFTDNLLHQNKQLEDALNDAVKSNDKINDDVVKYHQILQGIFERAYTDIVRVDVKGAFASDDEVGWIFNLLKESIQDVKEKLENMKKNE